MSAEKPTDEQAPEGRGAGKAGCEGQAGRREEAL